MISHMHEHAPKMVLHAQNIIYEGLCRTDIAWFILFVQNGKICGIHLMQC